MAVKPSALLALRLALAGASQNMSQMAYLADASRPRWQWVSVSILHQDSELLAAQST